MAGASCQHVHDESCGYIAAEEGVPCDKGCADDDGDGAIDHAPDCAYSPAEEEQPCLHVHDEACGYAETVPGQPCGYECHICPVQELIDALPDAYGITADNAEDAKAQLSAIDDAKAALTDDELAELDTARYEAAVSALNALEGMEGAEQPQTLESSETQTENSVAYVKIGAATTYYDTIDAAFTAAASGTATIELLGNATASNTLTVPSGADITLNIPTGMTLTSSDTLYAIQVTGGKLTVTGGGTITTSKAYCVQVQQGATFTVPEATTVIFESTNSSGYGLDVECNATATLSGGTFKGTKAIYAKDRLGFTLAPGYTFKDDSDNWLDCLNNAQPSETTTVVKVVKAPATATIAAPDLSKYRQTVPLSVTLTPTDAAADTAVATYNWYKKGGDTYLQIDTVSSYDLPVAEHNNSSVYCMVAGKDGWYVFSNAVDIAVPACLHENIDPDTGVCNACDTQMVASVTCEGEEIAYCATIQEAFDAAAGKTATIKMFDNDTLKTTGLTVSAGNITLDMDNYALEVYEGTGITVAGGTLTLENAYFAYLDSPCVEVTSGHLNVYSGMIRGFPAIRTVAGGATLYGGTFSGVDDSNAIEVTGGGAVSSLLPTGQGYQLGYAVDGTPATDEQANAASLSGEITIIASEDLVTNVTIPDGKTIAYGSTEALTPTFKLKDGISEDILTYQWYVKGEGDTEFLEVSEEKEIYPGMQSSGGTFTLRCDVTALGRTVQSNEATVTIVESATTFMAERMDSDNPEAPDTYEFGDTIYIETAVQATGEPATKSAMYASTLAETPTEPTTETPSMPMQIEVYEGEELLTSVAWQPMDHVDSAFICPVTLPAAMFKTGIQHTLTLKFTGYPGMLAASSQSATLTPFTVNPSACGNNHTVDPTTGSCSGCGTHFDAMIGSTPYLTLDAAVKEAATEDTIMLLQPASGSMPIISSNPFTVPTGKNLTITLSEYAEVYGIAAQITVAEGASLSLSAPMILPDLSVMGGDQSMAMELIKQSPALRVNGALTMNGSAIYGLAVGETATKLDIPNIQITCMSTGQRTLADIQALMPDCAFQSQTDWLDSGELAKNSAEMLMVAPAPATLATPTSAEVPFGYPEASAPVLDATAKANSAADYPLDENVAPTYQWYKDGEIVSGATEATYSPTGLAAGKHAYYCEVTCTDTDSSECILRSQTATVTVEKAQLEITGATIKPKSYDGNTAAEISSLKFSGLASGETLEPGTDYTVKAVFDNENAGTGKTVTVTVELIETTKTSNYIAPTKQFTLENQTIAKADSTSDPVSVDKSEVAYGDSFTVTAANIGAKTRALNKLYLCDKDGKELASGDVNGTEGTATYNTTKKLLAPGTHELTVKYGGSDNLDENPSLGTVTVKINPRPVTFDPITAGYTGTVVTKENVVLNNAASGDTVTVKVVTSGAAAGAYTVGGETNKLEATLSDANLEAYYSVGGSLEITKAQLKIKTATLKPKTYDGNTTAEVETVEFDGLASGDELKPGTDFTATAALTDPNAGTDKPATVSVTLIETETAKNYYAPEAFATTGTIEKAALAAQLNGSATVQKTEGAKTTVSLAAIPGLGAPPEGQKLTFTVQNGIWAGLSSATVDGDTLTLTASGGNVSGPEEVLVTVSNMQNYTDSDITVTVNYTDKQVLKINGVKIEDKTYDGNPLSYDKSGVSVSGLVEGKPFDTGKLAYNWLRPDGIPFGDGEAPVNAGSYTLKISVPENDPDYTGDQSIPVAIKKATVAVKPNDKIIRVNIGRVPDFNTVTENDYTVKGLVGNDKLTDVKLFYDGEVPSNDKAQSVPINVTASVTNSDNYELELVPGTLHIRQAGAILFGNERWVDDSSKETFFYSNKDAAFTLTNADGTAGYILSATAIDDLENVNWLPYNGAVPVGNNAYITVKFTPAMGEAYYVFSPKLELIDGTPVVEGLIDHAIYCEAPVITVRNAKTDGSKVLATNNDTIVTVNGKKVRLSADGTYQLQPDGIQTITVANKAGIGMSVSVTVNNGHDFNIQTVESTCVNKGIVQKTCKVCGLVETDSTAADGHTLVDKSEKPTCTKPGKEFKLCTICGAIVDYTEIPAEEHKPADSWKSDSVNHWHICSTCGVTMDLVKHTEGDWKAEGDVEKKYCTVCGAQIAERAVLNETESDGVNTFEKQTEVAPGAPETTIKSTATELWEAVKTTLTEVKPQDEEKALDVNITLKLDVKPLEETSADNAVQQAIEAIKAQAPKPADPDGKESNLKFIDISLNATKSVEGIPTDQEKVTQTASELAITISVPKEMYENVKDGMERTFSIMYYHGGAAKSLPGDYDKNNHTFTFNTKEFSTYALVYTDTKKEQPPAIDSGDDDNKDDVQKPSHSGGSSNANQYVSGGSYGGSGSSSGYVGPATTPAIQGTTISVAAKESDGKSNANVDKATADNLVDNAAKNNSENINVQVSAPADSASVTATIPSSSAKNLADKTNSALNIETPLATVVIPNSAVGELANKGKNTVGVTVAKSGDDVKITIQADSGDIGALSGVKASVPTDKTGSGNVAVILNPDGTESVVKKAMIKDGKIVVPIGGSTTVRIADRSKVFDDTDGHWAIDSIGFVTSRDLFNGISETEFAPNAKMTRAMLVTVLHRLEDNPDSGKNNFSDVPSDAWFTDAVAWAAVNGIVNGKTDDAFSPNDPITREQLAAILYRYANGLGLDTSVSDSLNSFSDAGDVSSYATEAISWAVGAGIINGKTSTTIAPQGDATRAEVSTMLMRLVGVMNNEPSANQTEVKA